MARESMQTIAITLGLTIVFCIIVASTVMQTLSSAGVSNAMITLVVATIVLIPISIVGYVLLR